MRSIGAARGAGLAAGLALSAILAAAAPQAATEPPGAANEPPAAAPRDWTERLEALRPQDPAAYFELAEEIADVAETADDRALARTLFGLAGALEPQRLGRSSALALADLEEPGTARRRLLALAVLLGGTDMSPPASTDDASIGTAVPPGAVAALVEAFSHYRRGRGAPALTALRKPGAMELLEACDRLLPGGTRRFLEDCKLYRGQLRPSLSADDVDRMLRLEIALLAGGDRPWSSELVLTGGRPLVEVDPQEIDAELGVDVERPYYRRSRWVAAPPAAAP